MLALAALLAGTSLISLITGFVRPTGEPPAEDAAPVAEAPAEEEPAPDETDDAQDAEREAYVSTWGARIDAYNAGTPLEGYGQTFAAAAHDLGVDPRFAPAIARVESGSGANCAYACNAWGWGTASWGDWDTAIWEYTAALGSAYGSTLSYGAALGYNEAAPDAWYAEVEAGMYQIWGSAAL